MTKLFKSSRPARDGESRLSLDRSNQNGPALGWNFQSSAPALRGGAASFRRERRSTGFRALSSSFFKAEAKREYRLEAAGFILLAALAAWPIMQALQAMAGLVR